MALCNRRPTLRNCWLLFCVLLLWFATPDPVDAQRPRSASLATLELRVLETETLQPLTGVRVHLSGVDAVVLTDRNGRARLQNIPPGRHILTLTRLGYAPERVLVEFTGSERVQAEIELAPQPITLEGIEATAAGEPRSRTLSNAGFYHRQKAGMGTFITRDDIERQRPAETIHLFRTMRGFRVTVSRDGRPMLVMSRVIWGTCAPDLYIDGMRVHAGRRLDPSEYVQPNHIEGIETYAGPASIPPEYNVTGSACGVVLIWTRS